MFSKGKGDINISYPVCIHSFIQQMFECLLCTRQCSRLWDTEESEIPALIESRRRRLTINEITRKTYCGRQDIVPLDFCSTCYTCEYVTLHCKRDFVDKFAKQVTLK